MRFGFQEKGRHSKPLSQEKTPAPGEQAKCVARVDYRSASSTAGEGLGHPAGKSGFESTNNEAGRPGGGARGDFAKKVSGQGSAGTPGSATAGGQAGGSTAGARVEYAKKGSGPGK